MTTINQWGFGEASAGSAVGLRSVYDSLHLLKKSLGAGCVYRLPSLLILITMVPLACWSGPV